MQICARRPLRSAVAAFALVAALALASCGDDDGPAAADGPDLTRFTPAEAPIYVEATVRPEGDSRERVDSVLSKLLRTDDPGAMIVELVDDGIAEDPELADSGFNYSDDVEPWLGGGVGGFISAISEEDGDGALLLGVTDEDAARDAIEQVIEATGTTEDQEERSYEGVDYVADAEGGTYGFVDDVLVIGTEQGFKDAIDASEGENLADDADASEALGEVRGDSLVAGYVDAESVVDLLARSGELPPGSREQIESQLGDLSGQPIAFSGGAEEDALAFEYIGPAGESAAEPTDALSGLSAAAWLAFAAPDVGSMIEQNLKNLQAQIDSRGSSTELPEGVAPGGFGGEIDVEDQLDRLGIDIDRDLGWIGDATTFVEGTSLFGLGGAVVLEATDEKQASAAIGKLQKALGRERSLQVEPLDGATGFRVGAEGVPVGAEVELRDGQVVLAAGGTSVDDALSPGETLADSESFGSAKEALGDGITPGFLLEFPAVLELVESSGQSDPGTEQAKQVLGPLGTLIAGSERDGDTATGRLVLTVREAPASGQAAAITP